jgi:hypothetical protein
MPNDRRRFCLKLAEQLGRVSGAAERDNLLDTGGGIAPIAPTRGRRRLDCDAAQINDGERFEHRDTLGVGAGDR